MTEYRRAYILGVTSFFTANLAERKENRLLVERIDELRVAFRTVRRRHPFRMEAVVMLPDHLHCVWTLSARIGSINRFSDESTCENRGPSGTAAA